MNLALLLVGGILISGSVAGQQPAGVDAVKAANQAFYAALSLEAMSPQRVWSSEPDITNIGPRSKAAAVGWDSIGEGLEATRDAFPALKVTMEPRIKIVVGAIAWASGIEQSQRKDKAGVTSSGTNPSSPIRPSVLRFSQSK